MAKALTNAAQPMGAVAISERIHDTIFTAAQEGAIEFFHGYTYSGHPLAAAAAIATLDVYAEEGLFEKAIELEDYWADAVHSMKAARHVIDCRNVGLIGGIELEPRPGAPTKRAMEVFHRCFDTGLLIRVTGDIIALSPPLIIEKSHIDEIFAKLTEVLTTID
jgi:beta-alanine--pyruvate transaminase